ncbi:hypothetical protein M513_10034 [Trichuris suis]|uniref:Signal peptidase complex catalytic subunit SEC11 n=1 Tax=Trichuris suis TaxID=68888 RepID=A0A085LVU6_9BILA|nr:hypothetical protein M513_10034 [Trichuris suis]
MPVKKEVQIGEKRFSLPGDEVGMATENSKLGPGLGVTKMVLTSQRCGIVKQRGKWVWLDYLEKRYVPNVGDQVVGQVTHKISDGWRVEVGCAALVNLPYMSFENATKRFRPNVQIGDLVYGKIVETVEAEMSCIGHNYGVLPSGGNILRLAPGDARRLLLHYNVVAETIGKKFASEITCGVNGWMKLLYRLLGFSMFDEVKRMNLRQVIFQVLNCAMIVSSALMIWKGLIVITGSESPIVVVLSGSMEPAFYRGDLLFLTNFDDPVRIGDITVFKVDKREIPIVHRVIKVHERADGYSKFLTKGDNNAVDDRGLYAPGQHWLERKDVIGRARGCVPYIGMVTILMNDYPMLKYVLLTVLGIFVVIHRE